MTDKLELDTAHYQLSMAQDEVKCLRAELNLADEIHYDEIKSANVFNGILTAIVIAMSIWIATT